jgi:hypothetical protein
MRFMVVYELSDSFSSELRPRTGLLFGARIHTILMETLDVYSRILSMILRFTLRPESSYGDRLHYGGLVKCPKHTDVHANNLRKRSSGRKLP